MKEDKSQLMNRAMSYGLIMGIAWVIKYMFFIFGNRAPILSSFYWGCTLAVPFIAYVMTKRYRAEIGGSISFFHAWRFGIMLYFCAALIVSVAHFVFYNFIAPEDFVSNAVLQTLELFKEMDMEDMAKAIKEVELSPIHMTIQQIFNNMFYGIVFSLPVAFLVRHKEDDLKS